MIQDRLPPTNFEEYVEQVRAATDLLALVSERFTPVADMIICPFHPDTQPSLHIVSVKQYFYCFGCKATGDVFKWIERLDGLPFRQAVDVLAERAGIKFASTPQDSNLALSARQKAEAVDWFASYYETRLTPEARAYLTEVRCLPVAFIERFRLGWSDGQATLAYLAASSSEWGPILVAAGLSVERQGRLVDHIRDRVIFPGLLRRRATFLSGRTLVPDVEPKYLNQRGMDALLYNEDDLNPDTVWVVEGQIDTLSLCAAGLPAVGCLGGVKTKHIQKLRRVRRVYALFDSDRAGRESTLKLCEALGNAVRIVTLPEGCDPNDFYRDPPRLLARAHDPIAWALSLFPGRAEPIEMVEHLVPLFRILSRRDPLSQEICWEQSVVPVLKLTPAGSKRGREILISYSDAAKKRCSQCGAVI